MPGVQRRRKASYRVERDAPDAAGAGEAAQAAAAPGARFDRRRLRSPRLDLGLGDRSRLPGGRARGGRTQDGRRFTQQQSAIGRGPPRSAGEQLAVVEDAGNRAVFEPPSDRPAYVPPPPPPTPPPPPL